MKFDIVFVNPPFNYIKEFEDIALEHSNQYVWMVAKISHMMDVNLFNKVSYFRNMGLDTFKEGIEICSYLRDKNKKDDIIQVDGAVSGTHYTDNIITTPSIDLEPWKLAQDVISLGLKGYDANRGFLFQREAKINPDSGIRSIWSSGGNKKDIQCDYVDQSQKDKLYGLGQHKVFTTHRYPNGKLGVIKYAGPDDGLGFGCIGTILENKEECLEAIEYLSSDPVKKLVMGIKLLTQNSKGIWSRIPHHSQKDKWFHLYDV